MDRFLKGASFLNKALGYSQVKVSSRLGIDDADTNGLGFHHNVHQLVGEMALRKQHSMVLVRLPVKRYMGSSYLLLFLCHTLASACSRLMTKIFVMLISYLGRSIFYSSVLPLSILKRCCQIRIQERKRQKIPMSDYRHRDE